MDLKVTADGVTGSSVLLDSVFVEGSVGATTLVSLPEPGAVDLLNAPRQPARALQSC